MEQVFSSPCFHLRFPHQPTSASFAVKSRVRHLVTNFLRHPARAFLRSIEVWNMSATKLDWSTSEKSRKLRKAVAFW